MRLTGIRIRNHEHAEEARILSVMMSRARHGLVLCHARAVANKSGRIMHRDPSRLLPHFSGVTERRDRRSLDVWLESADWPAVGARARRRRCQA